jgi:feruloyl esterase
MNRTRLRLALRFLVAVALAAAVGTAVGTGVTQGTRSASANRAAGAGQELVSASRQLAAQSPRIPARISCSSVATLAGLGTIPGYPTNISSATDVPAAHGNPEYCDVKGIIAPQTQFDLELPVSTWQGRYLQNGCGGYCGAVGAQAFPACDATLGGDFAMATDNEGHVGTSAFDGTWAFNDQQLRLEYGYLSEHALAVVAKTIIKDYYGTGPSRSYYDGCSDGGREAMEVAQRYPDDFGGIIAGAPEIIAAPLNAELQTWNYRVNTDSRGNAILTGAKLPALHAAAVKACGGDDGTADGIITDPRSCHFDPGSIQCPAGTDSPSCLTAAQVRVARDIYQGPADPQGHRLYPGGLPYGSELAWAGFVVPASAGQTAAVYGLSSGYLRYQMLPPGQLGPGPEQWAFNDQGFHQLFPVGNTYDAMSTDLRAFRAHGGKLLMWQGWADQAIPPSGTVDYYDQLTQRMGGAGATQQFARLLLFPTVYHCAGGYGAASFDLVLPMVNWVENGTAPAEVTASETDSSGAVTLSRPVYPYPLIPRYNGSGPASQASSFHPVTSPDASAYTPWIGDYLFSQPDS